MELLLNALWLLTAAGAITLWYYGSSRAHAMRLKNRTLSGQLVALGCALMLLFPVISVTDDLHAQQAVIEDSSRIILKARRAPLGGMGTRQAPALVFDRAVLPGPLGAIVGQVSPLLLRVHRSYSVLPNSGRSPPLEAV